MKLIALFSFIFIVTSCKSSKFENSPPFTVQNATYQNWYGGRPGVRGINIVFEVKNTKPNIIFKEVFFNKKKGAVSFQDNTKNIYIANINTARPRETILHSSPQREFGNELPKKETAFPFELKENECVISYLQKDKLKYYKTVLTKEKEVYYP